MAVQMPSLRDFNTPLPALLPSDVEDLGETFAELGKRLGPLPEPISLQVTLSDGESRSIVADANGCTVSDDRSSTPDVEIILTAATWREVASGAVSPLDAFSAGRMRVLGEIDAARRLVRLLHNTANTEMR